MEKINLKAKPVLKIAGLAILAMIVVYVAFVFLGSVFGSFSGGSKSSHGYSDNALYSSKSPAPAMSMSSGFGGMLGLSTRNADYSASSESYNNGNMSTGSDAEKFELTEYSAQIETKQLDNACAAVSGLKAREEVIFESAREYSDGCSYSFKVTKDKANDILALLKGMNPKELTGNTYTIQGQVSDYTSRIDILQSKLASIDDTLGKAVTSYNEVAEIATKANDVESLAKVIDSKINTIERLTQERIDINAQLDLIQRGKAQQVDRLDYTYFSVNIADGSFVDWQALNDSWNYAIKSSVNKINEIVQNISVNLVGFVFSLFQYVIYALILLVAAKYVWKLGRYIWNK